MFYHSRNRAGDHPREHLAGYAGIMGRRKLFDAGGAVEVADRWVNELFEIERSINGKTPAERVAVRQKRAKPLVDDLKV